MGNPRTIEERSNNKSTRWEAVLNVFFGVALV